MTKSILDKLLLKASVYTLIFASLNVVALHLVDASPPQFTGHYLHIGAGIVSIVLLTSSTIARSAPRSIPSVLVLLWLIIGIPSVLLGSYNAMLQLLSGGRAGHTVDVDASIAECQRGDVRACQNLTIAHTSEEQQRWASERIAAINTEMFEAAQLACGQGETTGCAQLQGGALDDRVDVARLLLLRNCDADDAAACEAMGEQVLGHPYLARVLGAGASFYKRACDLGRASACPRGANAAPYVEDAFEQSDALGYLSITTTPQASVVCAGKDLGRTPIFWARLPAGCIKVEMQRVGYPTPVVAGVLIKSGEVTRVAIESPSAWETPPSCDAAPSGQP